MKNRIISLVVAIVLLLGSLLLADGGVYWQDNGVLVCDSTQRGPAAIVAGKNGGAIIGWRDSRNYYSIYAQRVDSNGNMVWTSNGIPVCQDGTVYLNADISCVADDNGGAIFCWIDYVHVDSLTHKVFAQKIDSTGTSQWGINGIQVAFSDSTQSYPSIASDGAGGCIITWLDLRHSNSDIFAQRIDSMGTRLWGDGGKSICTEVNAQGAPQIANLSDTGAVIIWADHRYGNWDVFGRKIDKIGTLFWEAPICLAAGRQIPSGIVNAGGNHVELAWESGDPFMHDVDVYGQQLDANGDACWDPDGVVICNEDSTQYRMKIVGNGKCGIIAVWLDNRTSFHWDLCCQQIDSNGICMWDSNGIFIYATGDTSSEPTDLYPEICSDSRNGAIVTSKAYRNGNWDIYCQRIDSLGVIQWGAVGLPVCIDSADLGKSVITPDGQGGAIIAWADYRNLSSLYAQRVGDLAAIEEQRDVKNKPSYIGLLANPNPFVNMTKLIIRGMNGNTESNLSLYDSAGRLVKSVELKTNTYQLGTGLPAGIYFLKLNDKPVGKIVKLR